MNDSDRLLLDGVTKRLGSLGVDAAIIDAPRARAEGTDIWLRISKERSHADYRVELKRNLATATLGAIAMQSRDAIGAGRHRPLLLSNYVSPANAERLRAMRHPFVDVAGNAYLEQKGLFLYVTGRKPVERPSVLNDGTSTGAGLKITFAFLCQPDLAASSHRTIASAAGVALGNVPKAMQGLQSAGHLLTTSSAKRLNATRKLLDEWSFGYARRLRHKILHARYSTGQFDTWKAWSFDASDASWGGEPAASLLVKHLRPATLTVYASKLPARLLVEKRLVSTDAEHASGLLEHRQPFWNTEMIRPTPPGTVPVPLVYADLLAVGEARCIETAQLIYDAYLAQSFPAR